MPKFTKEQVLVIMPHYSEEQAEKHAAALAAAEPYREIFKGSLVEGQVETILGNLVTMAVGTVPGKKMP